MEENIVIPRNKFNSSYNNKFLTCQGIVTEISPEFEDPTYGYIQIVSLQSFYNDKQQIGVQQDTKIIMPEEFADHLILGDKVRIKGTMVIYNAHDIKSGFRAILANDLKKINEEEFFNLTEQDIINIKSIAKQPLIQYKIANYIYKNINFNSDIKLIGALLLFCTESKKLLSQRIHCNIGLLIVGNSRTYKTSYLKELKLLMPNHIFEYSQKSDGQFVTYNSRKKIADQFSKKAGLSDLAKNGLILIDNLGELKPYRLSKLFKSYIEILRKSSIISALHKDSSKSSLLKKFDIVLIADEDPVGEINTSKIEVRNDTLFSKELLKKYILYIRKICAPPLTEEAVKYIIQFKKEMIKLNKKKLNFNKTIDSTNFVRILTILSKVYASMALKETVDLEDVQLITRIYRQSLINLDLIDNVSITNL